MDTVGRPDGRQCVLIGGLMNGNVLYKSAVGSAEFIRFTFPADYRETSGWQVRYVADGSWPDTCHITVMNPATWKWAADERNPIAHYYKNTKATDDKGRTVFLYSPEPEVAPDGH